MNKEIKRQVSVSSNYRNKDKVRILSPYPIDKWDCECRQYLIDLKKQPKPSKEHYTCPKNKTGYNRYKVVCKVCNSDIAVLYAADKTLTDWCDLHYICESNGDNWNGCMAVNVSPIDEKLGFECSCGNDTRDFRANTTLPPSQALDIAKRNMQGRNFNQKNSKFKVINYGG